MQPANTRNIIGAMTATLWLIVGIYMVANPATETWRIVGFVVVALGVLRAVVLVRSWKSGKEVSRKDE